MKEKNYRVITGLEKIGKHSYRTLPGVLINFDIDIDDFLSSYQCEKLEEFYKKKLIANEFITEDIQICNLNWLTAERFKLKMKETGSKKSMIIIDCRAISKIEGVN